MATGVQYKISGALAIQRSKRLFWVWAAGKIFPQKKKKKKKPRTQEFVIHLKCWRNLEERFLIQPLTLYVKTESKKAERKIGRLYISFTSATPLYSTLYLIRKQDIYS